MSFTNIKKAAKISKLLCSAFKNMQPVVTRPLVQTLPATFALFFYAISYVFIYQMPIVVKA